MRRGSRLCFIALALVASWALAPPAWAGVLAGSEHDLTAGTASATEYLTTPAGSLCVVCHVPHGGSTSGLLWNHTLSSATLTFGAGATTVAGTILPTNLGTWTGTTKNCLSCHDGTVAIGSLISGTALGTTTMDATHTIGSGGNIAGMHPVGVPYPDQANAVYNAITSQADPTGFNASPTKAKLFGTAVGFKGIECASCHDPHDGTGNANGNFLRLANSGTTSATYICLNCHIK